MSNGRPIATLLMLCGAGTAFADDAKKTPTDPAAIRKAWAEFATPGKPHEELARLVGTWSTVTKSFEADPNEPSPSKGTATFEMLLGGRYLRQKFEGELEGQKFEGIGVTGYDNSLKKYVGAWIDTMGTGIMRTEGTYDPQTHTLTETGTSTSPLGEMKMKMTSRYTGPDEFVFTMFMVEDGVEKKAIEITYTRKK